MNKGQISEEKTAAASYILGFYNDVIQITHNYSNFENVILELKSRYGKEVERITLEEKDLVKQQSNILRYYVNKTFIGYLSIVGNLKGVKLDKDIEKLYTDLKNQQVIRPDNIKDYVIGLNKFVVTSVIKNLLESSQDLINNIYSDNAEEEAKQE